MKHILFVNPPNHRFETGQLAPPLGLLTLVEVARNCGWDASILDMSLPPWPELADDTDGFWVALRTELERTRYDVLGVTSMGVNTHVAMGIARLSKQISPTKIVIIGGIHATSIARDIRLLEPAIDLVVSNQGEFVLRDFLLEASGRGSISPLGPIDLAHPLSAYNSIQLDDYFKLNPRKLVNVEFERGCNFACKFCYSPAFYTAKARASRRTVRACLKGLDNLGAKELFLVQDNFLASRDFAEVCLSTLSEFDFTWECYVSLPNLHPELVTDLARTGCRKVYLGLDAAVVRQSKKYGKSFFKGQHSLEMIQRLVDNGIRPTCAFIADLYDGTEEDLDAVFEAAHDVVRHGGIPRINVLATYPGTQLTVNSSHCVYSELKARLLMDCPEVVLINSYAKIAPHLFPFHSTEAKNLERWREDLAKVFFWHVALRAEAQLGIPLRHRPDSEMVADAGDLWEATPQRRREMVLLALKRSRTQR